MVGDGLCECGCGQPTKIAPSDNRATGDVKGQPRRFVHGHARRRLDQWIVDPETGCWNWTGAGTTGGYGSIMRDYRMTTAHRWVYERERGPIPDGLHLDHLCRNRRCVNPDHLQPVTIKVNNRRGTQPKLSPAIAAEIRVLHGTMTMREIAAQFGTDAGTVSRIIHGQLWT